MLLAAVLCRIAHAVGVFDIVVVKVAPAYFSSRIEGEVLVAFKVLEDVGSEVPRQVVGPGGLCVFFGHKVDRRGKPFFQCIGICIAAFGSRLYGLVDYLEPLVHYRQRVFSLAHFRECASLLSVLQGCRIAVCSVGRFECHGSAVQRIGILYFGRQVDGDRSNHVFCDYGAYCLFRFSCAVPYRCHRILVISLRKRSELRVGEACNVGLVGYLCPCLAVFAVGCQEAVDIVAFERAYGYRRYRILIGHVQTYHEVAFVPDVGYVEGFCIVVGIILQHLAVRVFFRCVEIAAVNSQTEIIVGACEGDVETFAGAERFVERIAEPFVDCRFNVAYHELRSGFRSAVVIKPEHEQIDIPLPLAF